MTTRIVIKRYLTQSEKDRDYLRRGYVPEDKFLGSKVAECQQNVVAIRKLKHEMDYLDKQRKSSITKINSAQHAMKLHYKKFRSEQNERVKSPSQDCLDDQLVQVGFAFHSNGERKCSQTELLSKSICKLKQDVNTLRDSRTALTTNPDYDREMSEVTKLVANISACARRHSMHSNNVKYSHNPFLRSHQNEYFWHLDTGSARKITPGHTQPTQSFQGLKDVNHIDRNVRNGSYKRTSAYDTHRSCAQCVACESRLKQRCQLLRNKTENICKKPDAARRFLVTGNNSFHVCSVPSRIIIDSYMSSSSANKLPTTSLRQLNKSLHKRTSICEETKSPKSSKSLDSRRRLSSNEESKNVSTETLQRNMSKSRQSARGRRPTIPTFVDREEKPAEKPISIMRGRQSPPSGKRVSLSHAGMGGDTKSVKTPNARRRSKDMAYAESELQAVIDLTTTSETDFQPDHFSDIDIEPEDKSSINGLCLHDERMIKMKRRLSHDIEHSAHKMENFLHKFSDNVPSSLIHLPEQHIPCGSHHANVQVTRNSDISEPAKFQAVIDRKNLPIPTVEELRECRYLREYHSRRKPLAAA